MFDRFKPALPRRLAHGLSLSLLIGLSGCFFGGDDGDAPGGVTPPPVATEIPDSALASADAYTRYALSLPATDTTEPLNVDKVVTPPVSDSTEPLPLD